MRPVPWENVERYRVVAPGYESFRGDDFGAFEVPCGSVKLMIMASAGDKEMPWEHVSISIPGHKRTPTWEEMDFVKRLFWSDNETVMQLHVPRREHKNLHPWCLHLWRPIGAEIPRPPSIAVA